jgi:hypothetical protein
MRDRVLHFLSAYYPRYLCPKCLAKMMTQDEPTVVTILESAVPGLETALAECLNCGVRKHAARLKCPGG